MASDTPIDFSAYAFSPEDERKANAMLSNLDGFLTAVAIAPDMIIPSEWLPEACGGSLPEFASEEEANRVIQTIVGRYGQILHQVQNGPEAYKPVFWRDGDNRVIVDDWVAGFMDGYRLRAKQWSVLLDHEERKFLAPIVAHLRKDDGSYALLASESENVVRLLKGVVDATHLAVPSG